MNDRLARQVKEHLDPKGEIFRLVLKGEIFTLVLDDGATIVLNISAMVAHVAAKRAGVSTIAIALDAPGLRRQLAKSFFSPARLQRLLEAPHATLFEPVIAIRMDDGKTYVVDGVHRLTAWIEVFRLPYGLLTEFEAAAWKPYVLALPPGVTAFLRADTMSERKETP